MKKTAGYFRDGSNDGGLTTQAWSFFPSEESVKRSDASPITISERRASLTCVTAEGVEPSRPTLQISDGCVSALAAKKMRDPAISRAGIAPPFQRTAGAPPA